MIGVCRDLKTMIDINQELSDKYYGTSEYSILATAPQLFLTDGAVAANQKYGLTYFIEEISALSFAVIVTNAELKYFQSWDLTIKNGFAALICCDADEKEIYRTDIECDENFPNLKLKLFLIDKVLLLPSEY